MGWQGARPLISADPPSCFPNPPGARQNLGGGDLGGLGEGGREGAGGKGQGQDGDLPANSQREPPETRKKVSMSVRGAGLARHSRPGPQPRSSAAQQPPRRRRVFLAPAPAPQRPLPRRRSPVRPRGGRRALRWEPLPARSPRGSRASQSSQARPKCRGPGRGRAAMPTYRLRPAPAPNVRARRSGETGRRGGAWATSAGV